MESAGKQYLVVGALGLCLSIMGGEVGAAEDLPNEYLDMDISQLMNITITSVSKKEQRLVDAAAAVFVITQEDIRRSGVTNIPDALAMAPGLQVAKISASKWAVSSRGFAGYTSNKLLVLIDGRSVYSPAYSGTFWDMQNTLLEDIDRIEVIRGPGGTLWGANAVNGVINIITKKSSDTLGGLVRVGAGDQEKGQGALRYGEALNNSTAGRVYLTYNDRDSNKIVYVGGDPSHSGIDANDDWQSFQGGFRLDGQPQASAEWTLQGDLYQNRADQIIFPYWIENPPYLTENYNEIDTTGANMLGRYRRELTGNSAITIQAYYDYNDRQEEIFTFTFNTFDIDVQYETELGQRNSITMGTGYRQIEGKYGSSFQIQLSDADTSDNLYNAFMQDEIKLINDKLWLTLGAKWEHNDYTGSEWQPSGRLLFKPGVNHSFWTSIARAVRTPAIVEQKGSVLIAATPPPPFGYGPIYIKGNEKFESEEVIAYEAGYRWQARSDLSFDLSGFYNNYSGLYGIEPVVGINGFAYSFVNGEKGDSFGCELVADWQPASWLSFNFTYSYLDLELLKESQATEQVSPENFLAKFSPRNQASIRSSIDLTEKWQTNLWLRYTDEIVSRNGINLQEAGIGLDDYYTFNANLIWKPTDTLEVMLAIQNVFKDHQLQYVSEVLTPPTEIERGVYAKLTYNF